MDLGADAQFNDELSDPGVGAAHPSASSGKRSLDQVDPQTFNRSPSKRRKTLDDSKVQDLIKRKAELEAYLERLQAALILERKKIKEQAALPPLSSGPVSKQRPVGLEHSSRRPPSKKTTSGRPSGVPRPVSKVTGESTQPSVLSSGTISTSSGLSIDPSAPLTTSELESGFKLCERIVEDLLKSRGADIFSSPVDWQSLNLLEYPKIVKNPMDLGTVRDKLISRQYLSLECFESDIDLIWSNAKLFNPPKHPVHEIASQFESIWRRKAAALKKDVNRLRRKAAEEALFPQGISATASSRPSSKYQESRRKSSSQSKISSRPLSYEEKDRLRHGLMQIPVDKIQAVIDIIGASTSGGSQEIEVDIDKLDTSTLRRLQSFVRNTLRPAKPQSSSLKSESQNQFAKSSTDNTKDIPPYSISEAVSSDDESSSSFDSDSSDEEPVHLSEASQALPSANMTAEAAPKIVSPTVENNDVLVENPDAWSSLKETSETENKDLSNVLWKEFTQKEAEKQLREKELSEIKLEQEKKDAEARLLDERQAEDERRRIEEIEREMREEKELFETKDGSDLDEFSHPDFL